MDLLKYSINKTDTKNSSSNGCEVVRCSNFISTIYC